MPLVELARYYNSFEAGAAQSRLTEEGVDSVLFDLEMSLQGMGIAIPVRLMIDEDDERRAKAALGIA